MRITENSSVMRTGLFSAILLVLSGIGALVDPANAERILLQKGTIKPFEPKSREVYLVNLVDQQVSVFSEAVGEKMANMRDIVWFDGGRRVGFVAQEGIYAVEVDIWEETRLVNGQVDSFEFSADANVVYYTEGGRFVALDASGAKLFSTDFMGELVSCAPDGNSALLQTEGGAIYLFDLQKKSFSKIVDIVVDTVNAEWSGNSLFLYDYTSLWVVDRTTKSLSYFSDLKNLALSQDRSMAVFRKSSGQAVYSLDLASHKEKLLVPDGGLIHSAWSKSGEWIVLVSLDGRIHLVSKDGGQSKVVVDIPYDWNWAGMVLPFWSGRGDKFYYVQSDGVWEVGISGKRVGSELVTFPFWVAPNWGSTVEYGKGNVGVADLTTGKRTEIFETQDAGRWWSKWSPDGTMLLLYDFPPLPQWQ